MDWQERKQAWAHVWKEKIRALWQVRTRREKICLAALGMLFIVSPFLRMSEPTPISNAAKEPTVHVPQEKALASEEKSTLASKRAAGQQLQAKQELQERFEAQNPANLHDPFAPLPTANEKTAPMSAAEIPTPTEKFLPPANLASAPAPLPEANAELPPPTPLPERNTNVTPEAEKSSAPALRITGLLEGERRVLLLHRGDKTIALGEGESAQGVHLVTLEAGTAVLEVDGQTQRLAFPWGGK